MIILAKLCKRKIWQFCLNRDFMVMAAFLDSYSFYRGFRNF